MCPLLKRRVCGYFTNWGYLILMVVGLRSKTVTRQMEQLGHSFAQKLQNLLHIKTAVDMYKCDNQNALMTIKFL